MRRRWLPAAALALLAGCPDFGVDDAPYCDETAAVADVAGDWSLSAEGSRGDCADRTLDGELTLRSAAAFAVAAGAVSSEAGRPAAALTLARAYPVAFTGEVVGRCVRFRITEPNDAGQIRYRFEGRFEDDDPDADRVVRGRFSGEGPGSCVSRGSFSVRVE